MDLGEVKIRRGYVGILNRSVTGRRKTRMFECPGIGFINLCNNKNSRPS